MLCRRCASDIPVGEARRGEDHKARAPKGSKEKSILAGSVWPCLGGKEKLKAHNLTKFVRLATSRVPAMRHQSLQYLQDLQ